MNLANSRKEMIGGCLKPTLPSGFSRAITCHGSTAGGPLCPHASTCRSRRVTCGTRKELQRPRLVMCWTRKEMQRPGRTRRPGKRGAPGGGTLLLQEAASLLSPARRWFILNYSPNSFSAHHPVSNLEAAIQPRVWRLSFLKSPLDFLFLKIHNPVWYGIVRCGCHQRCA